MGYSPEMMAYKLYNPSTSKVVIYRDMVFHKNKGWDWSKCEERKTVIVVEELMVNANEELPTIVNTTPVSAEESIESTEE